MQINDQAEGDTKVYVENQTSQFISRSICMECVSLDTTAVPDAPPDNANLIINRAAAGHMKIIRHNEYTTNDSSHYRIYKPVR